MNGRLQHGTQILVFVEFLSYSLFQLIQWITLTVQHGQRMHESTSRIEEESSAFCHKRLTKIEAGWMKIALEFKACGLIFFSVFCL